MAFGGLVSWCGLGATLIVVGCHAPPASRVAQEPPWLLVRVEAVNVAPVHPGTRISWDGPAPEPDDGAECALLGLGVGLFNPIVGKGAQYLCQIGSRPKQREQDPSAPDLVVLLAAGAGATYQTYTARDTFYHVYRSEFVVPVGAIPAEGLSFTVLDRDGSLSEVIGNMRVGRQQLVDTALSSRPLLTLSDPRGGLQQLDLVLSPYGPGVEGTQADMNTQSGTMAAPLRPIRAGEVIEVAAAGRYRVGGWYDRWIDPGGYPGGGPRQYNFENEPFRSAPHGSAITIVGNGDAKMGVVIAPCASFVAKASGPLVLGVNDTEPGNNEGHVQFSVRIRSPTPVEWMNAQTNPCGS